MKLDSRKVQIQMAEQCMTVTELATKAELSRVFVSNCIKGSAKPKPATIGKIAKALNVPVQEIIETGAVTPEGNAN